MTAYARLKSRLDQGNIIILDGATGTELQRRGAPMDPAAWCGPATLENDHILTAIHRDYIEAGSDVVTANTFAASKIMLKAAGLADRSDEIVTRAVEAALKARTLTGKADVVVAGSLSHMVPVAEGTAKVDPSKIPSQAEISDAFHAVAHGLKRAGAELILLEMMYEPKRTKLAVEAALSTGLPVWFGMSARRGSDGKVKAFHHLEDLPIAPRRGLRQGGRRGFPLPSRRMGGRPSPRTAFLASIPACNMTLGFEVFVQEVIAAITTEPCLSS